MAFVVSLLLAIFVLDAPWSYVSICVGVTVEVVEAWVSVKWSRHRRAHTGAETLIGRSAIVVAACRPDGQVKIAGEVWGARCAAGAGEGERVRIRALDGLTLLVERVF